MLQTLGRLNNFNLLIRWIYEQHLKALRCITAVYHGLSSSCCCRFPSSCPLTASSPPHPSLLVSFSPIFLNHSSYLSISSLRSSSVFQVNSNLHYSRLWLNGLSDILLFGSLVVFVFYETQHAHYITAGERGTLLLLLFCNVNKRLQYCTSSLNSGYSFYTHIQHFRFVYMDFYLRDTL